MRQYPARQYPARQFSTAFAALLLAVGIILPAIPSAKAEEVDLALVLAVDVSYSMDEDEQRLQRLGYINAITSPQVLQAIGTGLTGKIALAYVEWGGATSQHTLVDWQVVSDRASAERFASDLARASQQRVFRTSISGGLFYSASMFGRLPHTALRKVIDISGDGPNNQGSPVHFARDEIVAAGVSINGLPLMLKRMTSGWYDIENLDAYYKQCVIGGPGSFAIPVRDIAAFAEAVRMKLVLEIAGLTPSAPDTGVPGSAPPVRNAAFDPEFCLIGERLWQKRMRDREWD
ncbi:DUF1194 domain-containing protein [Breoghania sp. L-A4]|uniref:DUF1194 domain-containing protein n=1 Tax=Breoghania sp. L-A4 TaxID=2304600 RepID=UPI000E360432|nr:DUF1194 domain-containing protein [Breoghania sp. L-A4]AXS39208.1 DUF1194 domain-containing protein [Breoghania sp. L-A4]